MNVETMKQITSQQQHTYNTTKYNLGATRTTDVKVKKCIYDTSYTTNVLRSNKLIKTFYRNKKTTSMSVVSIIRSALNHDNVLFIFI